MLRQLGVRQGARRSGRASSASTSTSSTSRSCSRRRRRISSPNARSASGQGDESGRRRGRPGRRAPALRVRSLDPGYDASRHPRFTRTHARTRRSPKARCCRQMMDGTRPSASAATATSACWNACCSNIDISLTPYDILRLKRRLDLTSTEFLERYTVPYEMEKDGIAGVKLRPVDGGTACRFMEPEGCGVYDDRPTACRYYPGRAAVDAQAGRGHRSRCVRAGQGAALPRPQRAARAHDRRLPRGAGPARVRRARPRLAPAHPQEEILGADDRQAVEAQPAALLHGLLRRRPLPRIRRAATASPSSYDLPADELRDDPRRRRRR